MPFRRRVMTPTPSPPAQIAFLDEVAVQGPPGQQPRRALQVTHCLVHHIERKGKFKFCVFFEGAGEAYFRSLPDLLAGCEKLTHLYPRYPKVRRRTCRRRAGVWANPPCTAQPHVCVCFAPWPPLVALMRRPKYSPCSNARPPSPPLQAPSVRQERVRSGLVPVRAPVRGRVPFQPPQARGTAVPRGRTRRR